MLRTVANPGIRSRNFDDAVPKEYYQQFASRANCLGNNGTAVAPYRSVFECLQNADTITLQNASAYTSYSAKYGQWSFIPVTDGTLLREQPYVPLLSGRVNGERILTGVSCQYWAHSRKRADSMQTRQSNGNEGTYFVRQNITTRSQFEDFLHYNFPVAAAANTTLLLSAYSIPDNFSSPKFDSNGLYPPYVTEVSAYTVGWYVFSCYFLSPISFFSFFFSSLSPPVCQFDKQRHQR